MFAVFWWKYFCSDGATTVEHLEFVRSSGKPQIVKSKLVDFSVAGDGADDKLSTTKKKNKPKVQTKRATNGESTHKWQRQ